MANLALPGPPVTYQVVTPYGYYTQTWGQWFYILFSKLGGTNGVGTQLLTALIPDIHTSTIIYIPVPMACNIRSMHVTTQATITGVDEVVQIRNAQGVVIGTIDIPVGTIAGVVHSVYPTVNTQMAQSSQLSITSAGLSSSPVSAWFTITLALISS